MCKLVVPSSKTYTKLLRSETRAICTSFLFAFRGMGPKHHVGWKSSRSAGNYVFPALLSPPPAVSNSDSLAQQGESVTLMTSGLDGNGREEKHVSLKKKNDKVTHGKTKKTEKVGGGDTTIFFCPDMNPSAMLICFICFICSLQMWSQKKVHIFDKASISMEDQRLEAKTILKLT